MENNITLLQETDLFKNLHIEQINKVLDICRRVRFAKYDIIMKEGDVGDSIYIILEGTVEVIKNLVSSEIMEDDYQESVKNKIITKLDEKSHAIFGEISLLDECKRTATVRAITDCEFYEIKRDNFLHLIEEHNGLGCKILLNLAGVVSKRLRKADEDIIKLTTVVSIILRESSS